MLLNNQNMDFNRFSDAVLYFWLANREKTACAITGDSMAPIIRHGDMLAIQHGSGNIRIGDVAVFKSDDRTIAHRVVWKHSDGKTTRFLLKGDASCVFDPPVSDEEILGKVVQVSGRHGSLYFDSNLWKGTNCLIATLSYLSGKCRLHDSLRWKCVRTAFVLISRVLPKRFSYVQVLFNWTCRLERSLSATH
jgi:signal peptidase I